MIEIDYNDREVQEGLQALERAAGNLRPALLEIGEHLLESSKQRFGRLIGPSGERWPANSPVTVARKGRNQPLTGETGQLQDSLHYQLINKNTLELGSPLEYASMQQFGGSREEFPHLWGDIPARPFLGVSNDDRDEILDIVQDHLERALK